MLSLSDQVSWLNKEKDRLNQIISDKDGIITEADRRLNESQEKCSVYLSEIAELNRIVDDKNGIIATADSRLNESQEKCSVYLSEIVELNRIVDDKNGIIAAADSRLNELQEKCNMYLSEVVELNQAVANKNGIIAEADHRLNAYYSADKKLRRQHAEETAKLEGQIKHYALDVDYMKNMIYNLQIENERMKGTISWRLTKPLRCAGYCVKCIRQMLTDHKIFYAKVRNSTFYKKYLKKFVPQKLKDKLMDRYFQTPEAMFVFENNDQERRVLDCLKNFEDGLEEGERLIIVFSGVK